MTNLPLSWLLAIRGDDPGCDAVFEALDRYVEAVLHGEDVTAAFAWLALHLRNCIACHEDTEGLLAALREIGSTFPPR